MRAHFLSGCYFLLLFVVRKSHIRVKYGAYIRGGGKTVHVVFTYLYRSLLYCRTGEGRSLRSLEGLLTPELILHFRF
jgi:hypothetical protein